MLAAGGWGRGIERYAGGRGRDEGLRGVLAAGVGTRD